MGNASGQGYFQRRYTKGQQIHEKVLDITNHQGKANFLLEWLSSQGQEINAGKDVEKREPLCTVGGNVNQCSHYGKLYGGSLTN